ncbi:hypothetical protein ACFL18_01125 [Patescibacteria group bacterium]
METPSNQLESKEHPQVIETIRVLVYSQRHFDHLLNELGQHDQIKDVLEWHIPIKGVSSQYAAGLAELAGGQIKKDGEDINSAAVRELMEELNQRQILSNIEEIGKINYQIPDYQKDEDTGDRLTHVVGIKTFTLDRPYPIDPDKAKIDRVISLTSTELKCLIKQGKVDIQTSGGEIEAITAIDYLQLGDTENPLFDHDRSKQNSLCQQLISFIDTKEQQIKDRFTLDSLESIQDLSLESAKKYLENFSQRGDDVFFPAMMYTLFGWGGKSILGLQHVDQLIGLLPNSEAENIRKFLNILDTVFQKTNEQNLPTFTQRSQFFQDHVEKELRKTKLSEENSSFQEHLDNSIKLSNSASEALIPRGAQKGQDTSLYNEVSGQSLYFLYEIIKNRQLYGEQIVNNRMLQEAAKILGFAYGLMRAEPMYIEAVSREDHEIKSFFASEFKPTYHTSTINQSKATVRRFNLSDELAEQLNISAIAVLIDQADKKDRIAFYRKRLIRDDTISDVFRRSVIIIGYFDQSGNLIKFDNNNQEDLKRDEIVALYPEYYAQREPMFGQSFTEDEALKKLDNNQQANLQEKLFITRCFFDDFRYRLAKNKALVLGSEKREKDIILSNLSIIKKPSLKSKPGSEADNFLWIKTYAFFQGSPTSEISELAIWASLTDIEIGGTIHRGYEFKKLDDEQYAFWRLAMILPWFHPDMIYQESVTQTVFSGKR